VFTFTGHHNIVYDLDWSHDGKELVSCSSDQTVKVWDVRTYKPECLLSLQHTSFVYAAKFHPTQRNPRLIFTGSYDGVIRIFEREKGRLVHTLREHAANINSLIFSPNGRRFFTADSAGIINIWEDYGDSFQHQHQHQHRPRSSSQSDDQYAWEQRFRLMNRIVHSELKGDTINCIRYYPRPEFLVVYCRDNSLYLFSLRRYTHIFF